MLCTSDWHFVLLDVLSSFVVHVIGLNMNTEHGKTLVSEFLKDPLVVH